ncbi:MAG: hypothetical protein RI101_12805 [Nitrospira sp.]|jgi:hypothetical protein|nr:hypothetical protein [Nitrospira sp.]
MPLTSQNLIQLNIGLGTLVVAAGFWLLWGAVPTAVMVGWTLLVAGFLLWKGRTITKIWAWSTLLVGLESFAWPLNLMVQLKSATTTPSDEEMGTVLSAVVLGLFAAVFWISFSYGLFKRAWAASTPVPPTTPPTPVKPPRPKKR